MNSNQQYNQIKSKGDFIRNCLTTNSLKQFWKGTDELKIIDDRAYADLTLDDLESNFIEGVYQDDITVIKGSIILLQGLNQGSIPAHDTTDITLNSISSFGIAVASQGGNPRYLYEEHKLKELFQCLAKNGIEVNFKIIRKNT